MSELKSFDIVVAEEGYGEGIVKYRRAVYDKSEADNVITKLKEKLVEQATLRAWAEIQLRHNKYKRCLAMARLCHERSLWWYSKGYGFEKYDKFWEKWEKRWLELADKFKENV